MFVVIQLRRDISTNWISVNPILADGEIGIERNTGKFKIGNGSSNWVNLPYSSGGDIPPELLAKIEVIKTDEDANKFLNGEGEYVEVESFVMTISGYNVEELNVDEEIVKNLSHTVSVVKGLEVYEETDDINSKQYSLTADELNLNFTVENNILDSLQEDYVILKSDSLSGGSGYYEGGIEKNSSTFKQTADYSRGIVIEDGNEIKRYEIDHNEVKGNQDNSSEYYLGQGNVNSTNNNGEGFSLDVNGITFKDGGNDVEILKPSENGTIATQEWVEANTSNIDIDGFDFTDSSKELKYTPDELAFRDSLGLGATLRHNKLIFDDNVQEIELLTPPTSGVIATREYVDSSTPPVEIGSVGILDTAPSVVGIYRAKESGIYTNLDNLEAKSGYITWFKFDGADWTLYSEVEFKSNLSEEISFSETLAFNNNFHGEVILDNENIVFNVSGSVENIVNCVTTFKMTGGNSVTFPTPTFVMDSTSDSYDKDMVNIVNFKYEFGRVRVVIRNFPLDPDYVFNGDLDSFYLVHNKIQDFDKVNGTLPEGLDYVHPSVRYFDNGWNGHKYWMGITPYVATQNATENPMLFYSDNPDVDGWKTLIGAPQPIYPKPSDGHNSDSCIALDPNDGVTLHYLNRVATSSGGRIEHFSSTDGISWTPIQVLLGTALGNQDIVSPSLEYYNNKWYIFGTPTNDQTILHVYEGEDFSSSSSFTKINEIDLSPLGNLWHCEVKLWNGEFYVLGSTGGTSGGNLRMGKFDNPESTELTAYRYCAIYPNQQADFTELIGYYKSSFIIKDNGEMEFFNGMKGALLQSTTRWRVRSEYPLKLENDWDKFKIDNGLVEVYNYDDAIATGNGWNTYSGIVQRNTNVWYFHHGIEAIIEELPFTLTMSRVMTGSTHGIYIRVNNNLLEVGYIQAANYIANYINYSVKVGDKISMFADKDKIRFFIKNTFVHEMNMPNVIKLNQPTQYGGLSGSLSNIKVYQLPQYLLDSDFTDNILAERMPDALLNPSDYFCSDSFERSTLGTTDDLGNTYPYINAMSINSSNRLGATTINGAIVLCEVDDSFEFYADMDVTGTQNIVYAFNMTDYQNYIGLKPNTSANSLVMTMVRVVSGTETVLATINYPQPHSGLTKLGLRFDNNTNVATPLFNNIELPSVTIPDPVTNFGLRCTLANRYIKNVNVKKI